MGIFIRDNLIKKALRKSVLFNNLRFAFVHSFSTKKNQYKNHDEKLNIVFLVARTSVWNSVKSFYDVAKKDKSINTYLIALPSLKNYKLDVASDTNYKFCKNIDPNAINAYNKNENSYFDIKALNPDLIVCPVPYDIEYPEEYQFDKLSKICRLCYISYGFSLVRGKLQSGTVTPHVKKYMSYIFVCNDIIYDAYKKHLLLSELISGKRLHNIGFPRFDLYRNLDKNKSNEKTTIMWLPRWTVKHNEEADGNEPSSFFILKDEILKYAENHPEVDLIIRPHPLAFDNYVRYGMMTEEEVENYKKRLYSLDNVILDEMPSYYESLIKADILISDFTSIIPEYFVTGRPVIYYGSGKNYPKEYQDIYNSFYHIECWEDVEKVLRELSEGKDDKKVFREKARDDFMKDMPENIGEHIVKIIKKDFFKK